MKGTFISFEGSEGSGKSTQIERLVRRLEQHGRQTLVLREPGGTPIGEEIRHLLLHHTSNGAMAAETELLLFAASRAQLVRERIDPALAAGKVVVCDRFLDSTTVYQGAARRLAIESVHAINQFAVGGRRPDLTLLLDVPVEVSVVRLAQRAGGQRDRIEREDAAFFIRVRDGYLALARTEPKRFAVFDSTGPVDKIAEDIWRAVHERLA